MNDLPPIVTGRRVLYLHARVKASGSINGLDKPGRSGDLFSFIVSCSLLQNSYIKD